MTWYSPPSPMSSEMVSKIPVGVSDQLAECGDGVDTPSVLRVRYQVVTHRAANCDHVSLQPEAPVVYHAGRQHADAPCPSRTVEARHRRKPCTSDRESALFGSRFLRMRARFVYASHARATAEDDIPGILAWSRQANPELGVTGVLCFLDGVYMQYIEGEETALEALFSSIRKDAGTTTSRFLNGERCRGGRFPNGSCRSSSGMTRRGTFSAAFPPARI